ncbi:MAG: GNAT family N-acetyltransferase [Fusobacteriaceae bacterium]|nr:GNAT family N-acetyltransferase [Fusobacteriaceae bacterium]MBN2838545.1 GNAT family N-acetyltransferase [Fusobacteriaceae bacterium]
MDWYIKKFEQLSLDELYDILKMRSEIFVVEQECVYLDVDGKDKDVFHLFLKENNKILAYCRILPRGIAYEEASIGRVIVNKNFRKEKLGETLMTKAISYLKDVLKEKEIKIQAQAYLRSFYKKFGFQEISDEYLEDGIPHIDMEMKL